MALVSKNIIEEWYQTDSWVYKNFSRLFSNIAWDKEIPKGFSLCPYFWLSILSLFIVQPFIVFPVFCIKKLYSPVDEFCRERLGETGAKMMFTVLLGLAVIGFSGIVLFSLGAIIIITYQEYALANAVPAFILPIVLFVVFFCCAIYIGKNRYNSERCKVENYTIALSFIFLALSAFLMPSEFIDVFVSIASSTYSALNSIVELIVVGSLYLWGIIQSFYIFPLAFLVFSSVGYVALITLDKFIPEETKKQREKRIEVKKHIRDIIESLDYEMRHFVGVDSADEAKVLMRIILTPEYYNKYSKDNQWVDGEKDEDGYRFTTNKFIDRLKKDCLDLHKQLTKKRETKKYNRRRYIEESVWCKQFTEYAGKFVAVCKWPFRQGIILSKVVVTTVKSRKQGFCPYMRFTDPDKK